MSRKLANFLLIAFCVSSFCIDDPLLKETSSESRGELLSRHINWIFKDDYSFNQNKYPRTNVSVLSSIVPSIYLNPSKLKLWRKPLRSVLKLFLTTYLSNLTKCLIRLYIVWRKRNLKTDNRIYVSDWNEMWKIRALYWNF